MKGFAPGGVLSLGHGMELLSWRRAQDREHCNCCEQRVPPFVGEVGPAELNSAMQGDCADPAVPGSRGAGALEKGTS